MVTGTPAHLSSKIPALTYEIAELSARFKEEGMLAYVELIQRKEKEIQCDILTHQKWCISSLFSRGWELIGRSAGAVPTTSIGFFQPCLQDHRVHPRLVKIPQNIPSRFPSMGFLASARRHDACRRYLSDPNTCRTLCFLQSCTHTVDKSSDPINYNVYAMVGHKRMSVSFKR